MMIAITMKKKMMMKMRMMTKSHLIEEMNWISNARFYCIVKYKGLGLFGEFVLNYSLVFIEYHCACVCVRGFFEMWRILWYKIPISF